MSRYSAMIAAVLVAGCSEQERPAAPTTPPVTAVPATEGRPRPSNPKEVEAFILKTIAEQLSVDRSAIDMNRPIGSDPLGADSLDMIELIMEIEEGLNVAIPDKDIEEISGAKVEEAQTRITPAHLVTLALRAQQQSSKTNRASERASVIGVNSWMLGMGDPPSAGWYPPTPPPPAGSHPRSHTTRQSPQA